MQISWTPFGCGVSPTFSKFQVSLATQHSGLRPSNGYSPLYAIYLFLRPSTHPWIALKISLLLPNVTSNVQGKHFSNSPRMMKKAHAVTCLCLHLKILLLSLGMLSKQGQTITLQIERLTIWNFWICHGEYVLAIRIKMSHRPILQLCWVDKQYAANWICYAFYADAHFISSPQCQCT